MVDGQAEFSALMSQVREGSEAASRTLVTRYGTHVLRVVRRKLNPALRPKFDSQDFVQAVWASFFAFRPDCCTFDEPKQLAAFLAELAQNKVVDAVRQRLNSKKYNVNREHSLRGGPARHRASDEPTAEEIAIAREEWERFFRHEPAHYRQMIELLLAGHGREEVAQHLGLNERTVRRVVHKLLPRPEDDSN